MHQLLLFFLAGGDVACGQLCQVLQRTSERQERERAFGVGAAVLGKSEESGFITVVGNKEICLVMSEKEK